MYCLNKTVQENTSLWFWIVKNNNKDDIKCCYLALIDDIGVVFLEAESADEIFKLLLNWITFIVCAIIVLSFDNHWVSSDYPIALL